MQSTCETQAAILAGGLGTRLRPVVSDRPKVLADVAGRPYLLDQLAGTGVREAVLCCGYMAEMIEEHFGETYKSLRLVYSREDEPLGTGGALRLALPGLSSDIILVMNGDSYVDADLNVYLDWFFEQNRRAALLLTKVDDISRYASVQINNDKTIASFREKCDNAGAGWINAGIYLIKKELIASIPSGRFYSLEKEFFPAMATKGLYGFCCQGRFIDIGTTESYAAAEDFFAVYKADNFQKNRGDIRR